MKNLIFILFIFSSSTAVGQNLDLFKEAILFHFEEHDHPEILPKTSITYTISLTEARNKGYILQLVKGFYTESVSNSDRLYGDHYVIIPTNKANCNNFEIEANGKKIPICFTLKRSSRVPGKVELNFSLNLEHI